MIIIIIIIIIVVIVIIIIITINIIIINIIYLGRPCQNLLGKTGVSAAYDFLINMTLIICLKNVRDTDINILILCPKVDDYFLRMVDGFPYYDNVGYLQGWRQVKLK